MGLFLFFLFFYFYDEYFLFLAENGREGDNYDGKIYF